MNLPETLQAAIEKEAESFNLKEMAEARRILSQRYRERDNSNYSFMRTAIERCAYIAARMPATFAVCKKVLSEILIRAQETSITSVLDLGAGPGTACWAAAEIFPSIELFTLIEQDSELIKLGKRLAAVHTNIALQQGNWQSMHLNGESRWPTHDLVVCSYSLGELPSSELKTFISSCWQSCSQFLIVIEPGTPHGFEVISTVRESLIDLDAYMVAPCPHKLSCPLKGNPNRWCHFAKRIERSFLHSHIKDGILGFEDEKYTYMIFSKLPVQLPEGRLLASPLKRSGHVCLDLCTISGKEMRTLSKRTKEEYKFARKLEWGDAFIDHPESGQSGLE